VDFLAGLNPQQREAAEHGEGALLILAGAGSGKTRVITHRMAHLVHHHNVPGYAVLAVTFTNKAAKEMKERVHHLLGQTGGNYDIPQVATFHSFCVRFLRKDGDRLADLRQGFTRQFNIYDDDDQISLIKQIYKGLGLDEKFLQYRAMLSRISHAKNQQETAQDWHKHAKDPKMSRMAVVFDQYEERLRQANAVDFDDLLLETVRLLRHDAALRELYNRRYSFLMVDEYQDTNRTQYDLMRLLSDDHGNVVAVGDEDQSIYSWRGADIRNILDFERDYQGAKIIRLEQNYRSTKNIIEAASAVVANNLQRKGKNLWTDQTAGPKIGLYEAIDGENEALWIADRIDKVLDRDPATHVAVLYRTNFQSRQIEEALRRYGRKYNVVGGVSFYQRAEVKDALSYLKLIVNPGDSIALLRVVNTPARGIGKTTMDAVEQAAREGNLSLWDAIGQMIEGNKLGARAETALELFRKMILELRETLETRDIRQVMGDLLEKTGYIKMLEDNQAPENEGRLANLQELLNAAAEAAERGEGVAEFLDHAALVSDADSVDQQSQISLLTIHNAKGLEFPVVFLSGMEENLFPHSRAVTDDNQMEEERRLCYVGMTRARQQLYLSWARMRRRFGGGTPEVALTSRFIREVPEPFTERISRLSVVPQMDLRSERWEVRDTVKKYSYSNKPATSTDNINQFFGARNSAATAQPVKPVEAPKPAARPAEPVHPLFAALQPPVAPVPPAVKAPAPVKDDSPPWETKPAAGKSMIRPAGPPSAPSKAKPAAQPTVALRPVSPPKAAPAKSSSGIKSGSVVQHARYGKGTVLRREGDGEDAKLVVSFPGYGLKKLIEKFAGIRLLDS
jgi:DNA helicase II / ATP-dependent DNA helicase PcrA